METIIIEDFLDSKLGSTCATRRHEAESGREGAGVGVTSRKIVDRENKNESYVSERTQIKENEILR